MRHCTTTLLLAATTLLTVSTAQAASTNGDNRSTGVSPLAWQTRQTIVGPNSGKLGASALSVQMSVNMDPVADVTRPSLAVDMSKGVTLEARWTDAASIDLGVLDDGTANAMLSSEHALAPHVTVFLDFLGFKATYDYSAVTLIGFIPGSAWNYDATGTQMFVPWAFGGATLSVPAPSLDSAQLFSIPIPNLAIAGNPVIEGQLAVNATTAPTFTYATTSVVLNGGAPITAKDGVFRIPTTDADFLDVPAVVKGKIDYHGTMQVRPSVTINKIAGFSLPAALTLDLTAAGVTVPFSSGTSPVVVEFPPASFHIPLPNVKVTLKSLDLGKVDLGKTEKRTSEVRNTGEMAAAMTFQSSNPQFTVTGSKTVVAAKGKYDLEVSFKPTDAGPQSADITVTSNDPNEPVQVIKVTGNGAQPTVDEPKTPGDDNSGGDVNNNGNGDSGCGCRTAPSSSDAAGFGVVGLVLAAVLRRRRR